MHTQDHQKFAIMSHDDLDDPNNRLVFWNLNLKKYEYLDLVPKSKQIITGLRGFWDCEKTTIKAEVS